MDNTQSITLSDIADTYEFLENPLDVYESYTYNIEWFVVDRDVDAKFQEFGETLNVETIVRDGWPTPTDTKITIAKTGVTTEFNITDLSIESMGAGIAETSKIAGTAIKLDFTVTEVGTTSLVDNLQNAIALCGWKDISTTHFYMKINFVGFDTDGKKVKLPQTKVLTFTIDAVTRLQSTTDARGTVTVLRGPILQDIAISDKNGISVVENGFTYEVAESLIDTLGVTIDNQPPKEDSFMDKLNKGIGLAHPTLSKNLQNTYKITVSNQFKEWIKNSSMTGITSNTIKNMKPPDGKHIGQVMPKMNIFNMINDICINTKTIKEDLTRDTAGLTKVHKISPWMVPKKNGYNPITGEMAYDVEFFIDYEKKIITQNMLDQALKTTKIHKTVKELFDDHHVNKIYHYLFTGENDQILDFNITLDQYLAKEYSAPTDWYAYENILKASSPEGKALLVNFAAIINKDAESLKKLTEIQIESNKIKNQLKKDLEKEDNTLRRDLLASYAATTGAPPGAIVEMFKDTKSLTDLISILSKNEDFVAKFNIGRMTKNYYDLELAVQEAIEVDNRNKNNQSESVAERDARYGDYLASWTSVSGEENWKNGVKQNAQKLLSGVTNKNPKNMILLEELDDDIISKMSNEDFENILKSQANNPIVYKSLITTMWKNQSVITIKPTDPEGVDMARAKYYESASNNISMINATLTIKGDPHWLDGYMSPSLAKKEFGNSGAHPGIIPGSVTKQGYNADLGQTVKNGANGLILKSGVAAGTDLHDNVLKKNLITSLYIVTSVNSSFSGGLFTQQLGMVKLSEAESWSTITKHIGPVKELDDKNDNDGNLSNDGSAVGEIPTVKITAKEAITGNPHDDGISFFHKNGRLYVGTVVWVDGIPYDNFGRRLFISGELPIVPKKDQHANISQYNDRLEATTDNIVISSAISNLGNHAAPFLDNLVRNNLANDLLDDMKDLSEACQSGVTESCTAVKDSQNKILGTLGLTIEDQGKASTILSVNTQLNDVIANANAEFMFSEEEIAMYQIAAGGELSITGFDQDAIEKIVVDTTGIKTPTSILTHSSEPLGASRDNKLLNGGNALVDAETEDTKINVPMYTWTKQKHLSQITHPNSNNDWKNTYWFKKKVEDIKNESCPPESKKININTRKLECVGIDKNTLTNGEVNDVTILTKEINDTLFNGSLRDQHGTGLIPEVLAKQYLWTDYANALIEKEIADNDLVITEDNKTALKTAVEASVHQSVSLDALSDNDYRKIQGYETEINKIVTDAYSDGHRGDVTRAVNVGLTDDALVVLDASRADTVTKLNQYFWNTDDERVWADQLEDTEIEMAELMLGQPNENMAAIATIITGGNKEYISIYNPLPEHGNQPYIIKTLTNNFDVILPGVASNYGLITTENNLAQMAQAQHIYKKLTSTSESNDMTTVTDDMGIEIRVKDFSNISKITYIDATGTSVDIDDPSAEFGLYTMNENNMYPANKQDYADIRQQIADLFPNIGVISANSVGNLSTTNEGTRTILINGTAFYINP